MTYKQVFRYIFMVLTFIASTNSFALSNHGYALDYVQGEGDVKGLKLAYQYHAPQLQSILKNSHVYLESSINIWEYGAENKHQTNLVLAISPVLQYPIGHIKNIPISIEAGIGFSLIDDTYFASKNVSTHYQFEDRIGFVAEFGDVTTALRYLHYSNAGFKRPNPGLDFISLSLSKRF
ncbi:MULTISPECIES: acyloxyacyl hydrolase [unclassified Pseudoalteromonas]|uniref:acyloxyacyl hydrolase n=1 Tax=unclassified Pseudoalteromonas TaxID=194690 RepID=UPI000B3C1874|nr:MULTISPECIES: acyloxyacyl hydrolase [unclassified Pseudoalteromonas]MDN3380616.1 acyloxyacyl hydrolase [Pseudoalteromonas sp. APC 3893]MDN3389003.1 acyloxyacyl hydrolase [Pseudoalteromonas sp. APC 4017]OUS68507.1 acyloxyacyl hydrolase [Pseudoalteromonas sp. A601]